MDFKKQVSPKLISLVFGILVVCFLFAFYISAWTEPSQVPPDGNISMPLNSTDDAQSKAGGLILNTGGAEYGLIVEHGRVGIGTVSPLEALDLGSGNFTTTGGTTAGYIQPGEYRSSFGNPGITATLYVRSSDDVSICELVFQNGLLISTTCPTI